MLDVECVIGLIYAQCQFVFIGCKYIFRNETYSTRYIGVSQSISNPVNYIIVLYTPTRYTCYIGVSISNQVNYIIIYALDKHRQRMTFICLSCFSVIIIYK